MTDCLGQEHVDNWGGCVTSAEDTSDCRAEAPQEVGVVSKPEVAALWCGFRLRQSAGLLWLTADTLHTQKRGSGRDAAGYHVTLDGFSSVHICCVFILYKKAHPYASGCCPLTVTPYRSDDGGEGASIGVSSGISDLPDPRMHCGPGRAQPDPLTPLQRSALTEGHDSARG